MNGENPSSGDTLFVEEEAPVEAEVELTG